MDLWIAYILTRPLGVSMGDFLSDSSGLATPTGQRW
ncbi:putative membrane-anchored protein [Streptomyces sp. B3I8]|nr:putative membrane-anchored protein [Streptomyces sp. B3I8]